ncbi:WD domain, G-beta repeat [Rosistilla carotiformis]|uniref:WD domain, G-beta repeat n=1 Tax=Rosistilla carotiformis TaxID=2528017 RepID=A0A518JLL9_9BACT|nr:hypothetical protein [Rosistilla carotiformis]QDV66440.1 WD domain, G-beta repeat [Rosistilla carotiformis]
MIPKCFDYRVLLVLACILGSAERSVAQVEKPVLVVAPGGPRTSVTRIAFCDQGKLLLTAGWDKTVQGWQRKNDGDFQLDAANTHRIPIGPGQAGTINAIAVSSDNRWLAIAGKSRIRGASDFQDAGRIYPVSASLTNEMKLDRGVIHLVDRTTNARTTLRGHTAPVVNLAFATDAQGLIQLFSVAADSNADDDVTDFELRRWNMETKDAIRKTFQLPQALASSQIAVVHDSREHPALAIAWFDDRLRLWNTKDNLLTEAPNGVRAASVFVPAGNTETILVGSGGQLREWRYQNNTLQQIQVWDLPRFDDLAWLPQSIATLSSTGEGTHDRIAIGATGISEGMGKQAKLIVYDFPINNIAAPRRELPLWAISTNNPPPVNIAVSENSEHMAVSGNPGHQLAIFKRTDLLGQSNGSQKLTSRYHEIESARFGTLADQDGLMIRESGASSENLALNFSNQLVSVIDETNPWKSNATPSSLKIERDPTIDNAFKVTDPERTLCEITLPAGQRIRFAPVLSTSSATRESVVAVATESGSEYRLLIYNANTGELIRELRGHDGPILFSDDGQLIAATTVETPTLPPTIRLRRVAELEKPSLASVPIQPGQSVSAIAVPDSEALKETPILVAATHIAGQEPRLTVFDTASGAPIRELAAHSERIQSIAFSKDAKLLVSTARDRTLCAWDLSDLNTILGKHGSIAGVQLDNQAVVKRIRPLPAGMKPAPLQKNDRLISIVDEPAWKSGLDLFHRMWQLEPGSVANVVVQRGTENVQLALPVSQASDERKPLFSLLIADDNRPGSRRWIGWTPSGPFETSSESMMKAIGWHFNTGQPEHPVTYAEIGAYRDQYYRSKLITSLISTRTIPPAPPLPRPTMSMLLLPGEIIDSQLVSSPIVRQAPNSISLSLLGRLPAKKIGAVEFQFDQQAAIQPTYDSNGSWTAALPEAMQSRGLHSIQAVVHTNEQIPQSFTSRLQYHFIPPPPQIQILPQPTRTKDETYSLKFTLEPTIDTDTLDYNIASGDFQKRGSGVGRQEIELSVPLSLGNNAISISVVPRGGDPQQEAARTILEVFRYMGPVAPPVITLNKIQHLHGGQVETVALNQADPALLDSPKCKLQGSIDSPIEPLTVVRVLLNDQSMDLSSTFQSAELKKFQLNQVLRLQPGDNQITIESQTKSSPLTSSTFAVVYQPAIPKLEITGPSNDTEITEFLVTPQVTLTGRIRAEETPEAFTVNAFINGIERNVQVQQVNDQTVIQETVPLRLGQNIIDLDVRNAWHKEPLRQRLNVYYAPRPVIMNVATETKPDMPYFSGVVQCRSASPIEQITFDAVPVDSFQVVETNGDLQTVRIEKLDFIEGKATAELKITSNETSEPLAVELPKMPLPTAPEIELVSSIPQDAVTNKEFDLRFNVNSKSPTTNIEVRHRGKTVYQSDRVQNPIAVKLDLVEGMQPISISVSNAGGVTRRSYSLNRLLSPAQLILDSIRYDPSAKETIPIELRDGHLVTKTPLKAGRVWLQGRVKWLDSDDPNINKPLGLSLHVNGFQQLPVRLDPLQAGAMERTFLCELFLNAEDNEIQVDVPEIQLDRVNADSLHVICDNPVQRQRLRLVLVGVGPQTEQELREEVFKAIGIRKEQGRLVSPQFSEVYVAGVLTGDNVGEDQILSILGNRVRRVGQKAMQQTPANEVVAVYFRGVQVISQEGRSYLKRSADGKSVLSNLYTLDGIHQQFESVCGAKVLLMDLVNDDGAADLVSPFPPVRPQSASLGYAIENVQSPAQVKRKLLGAIAQIREQKPTPLFVLRAGLEAFAQQDNNLSFANEIPDLMTALQF